VVAVLVKTNYTDRKEGQDLTYGMYRAFDELEQMVNLVAIDSKFDFGKKMKCVQLLPDKIIIDEPNNLFNYCNIGYQTYYNSQEEIDLIENYFLMHIAW
jgi:hypothetical protein